MIKRNISKIFYYSTPKAMWKDNDLTLSENIY